MVAVTRVRGQIASSEKKPVRFSPVRTNTPRNDVCKEKFWRINQQSAAEVRVEIEQSPYDQDDVQSANYVVGDIVGRYSRYVDRRRPIWCRHREEWSGALHRED